MTENAIRGSRRRLDGQRRPTALLMTNSSPSSVYQMTAWRGAPSGSVVAIVAKRGASRKARMSSGRAMNASGRVAVGLSVIASMVREGAARAVAAGASPSDAPAALRLTVALLDAGSCRPRYPRR